MFEYHHYHSTAWEVLLCVRGSATVQFGGPDGPPLALSVGDAALVPPGVAHRQLAARDGFTLLGAYPDHEGCRTPAADTVRGPPTPRQARDIGECPAPRLDPLRGDRGVLLEVLRRCRRTDGSER